MLMKSYGRIKHGDEVAINFLKAKLPIYGRFCDVSLSFYHIHGEMTTINFGMKASTDASVGVAGNCNKLLKISQKDRQLEQEIYVPYLSGTVLDASELKDGGKDAATAVADAIFERSESIIETVRQSIIKNFASSCRDQFVDWLCRCYQKHTELAVKQFLNQVNWPFLFDGVKTGDEFIETMDAYFANKSLEVLPIWSEDFTTIPIITLDLAKHSFDKFKLADLKATVLLGQVCGKSAQEEFKQFGCISVSNGGYDFVFRPGQHVECKDPYGHIARLCVHTVGYACNVIDELVIGWLTIKHDFARYIKSSNIFGSADFVPPWKLKKYEAA